MTNELFENLRIRNSNFSLEKSPPVETTADVYVNYVGNIMEDTCPSQKYWDHVNNHFVNFRGLGAEDPTRIVILKEYPFD